MEAGRVLGAVLGAVVVLATSASVLRTLVIPGARAGWITKLADRLTGGSFQTICKPVRDYKTRHRILAAHAPVMLALTLAIWMGLYVLGYGLLLWPATHGFARGLREAGSSLLTLGFASTHGAEPTVVDLLAAATGLVVVALQIAYLPTLYASFNRRETEVTLVGVRAGHPAWGPELLARNEMATTVVDLPEFYRGWERWASDVAESHSSYPILVRFRSPDPRSSWLIALLAVMDSAALLHALSPGATPAQARLSLRMGIDCLRQIARTIGIPFENDPRPDEGIQLTRGKFDEGLARLRGVGFRAERTPDEAWRHFQGWRVNYESIAYRLAYATDSVPARWSGPRRFAGGDEDRRPFLNRTPDDPDGVQPLPSPLAPHRPS
jgi:hypothetical protein